MSWSTTSSRTSAPTVTWWRCAPATSPTPTSTPSSTTTTTREPGVVRFDAELSSAGRYGLFFDFQHDGTVHTASFTFDQGAVTGAADMEH